MGFLSELDKWFSSRGKTEESPVMVVQYGSTKSYSFRRDVLRDNFPLPAIDDQSIMVAVFRAAKQFYLPDFTDEDFDNLHQLLIAIDDVILGGLKDPGNWVLPKGFSDIPFVRVRLGKNYPIEQILDYVLAATRLYIWLYKDEEEAVSELIPQLLELEESFEILRTRQPMGTSSNRDVDRRAG